MRPSLRRFALTIHITISVSWIGAGFAYLILGIVAVTTQYTQTIRATWSAMELIGWFAIVPLAVGSLLTGLAMSLGSKWGLARHYWTLISFILTVFATIILLFHMRDVSDLATVAQTANSTELVALGGDLAHSSLGLVTVLIIQILNVYKPRGLTRYGWRKQQAHRKQ